MYNHSSQMPFTPTFILMHSLPTLFYSFFLVSSNRLFQLHAAYIHYRFCYPHVFVCRVCKLYLFYSGTANDVKTKIIFLLASYSQPGDFQLNFGSTPRQHACRGALLLCSFYCVFSTGSRLRKGAYYIHTLRPLTIL